MSAETVRADFNDPLAVVHYTRAAHFLGLWKSEKILIERFFTDKNAALLEAGCGSGRVTLGLWHEGYRNLTAFDFAEELVEQARNLADEQSATAIKFLHADATRLRKSGQATCHLLNDKPLIPPGKTSKAVCHLIDDKQGFDGALFMFNGLMQIPGRENRRAALRELRVVCKPGAPLLFTTHDRDSTPTEQALWRLETLRWAKGKQDARLIEFGDRYFEHEAGRTFMHLPNRDEILEDLAATGWRHTFDSMRRKIARESRAVVDFSDECRFWSAIAEPTKIG
ncbi:MAG: class I SAM-dependent methyltransferase [Verrucomicrobia bacterium]|nr:class I SAM-dependent methyltransferase [Verrucomicrobiota bacterium]